MKVVIALASYNGARFFAEQLASLAAQTRLPDALIVCDDGSTDGTAEIAEAFAATAPFPVRVERNAANLGFNGNFERVVSLADGDLVFISDQDDIWHPDKIARVLAALEANPSMLMAINDEELMDGEGRRLGVTFLQNARKLGYPDSNHVAGCCSALRRELIPLLLPFPKALNYDGWVATLADLLGTKLLIEAPLQLYRRHGGNSTESVMAKENASTWDLVRLYGTADPREAWRAQIDQLGLFRRRIEERRALAVSLVGEARVAAALARIASEGERLERRLQLLAKGRVARLPAVLKLWRGGFYRDFAGGKSAIKDIIRA
ncbi:MAG: glycosyltransferase family 2 protein [Alphaproteobacteria bacterium]|nr:glycosyltransferase family 2 protein [Alphaproteobacteria bacterium]MBV9372937.1 glycosyltransferase family 2 protein [Alphaproteobacteria bacterium]MBV9900944.1 glycosyltransferase family 2 protein [Alphaproteobacteria bacterium]